MKCFNHPDIEAVGVCSSCGKAICSNCSMVINNKVTCKSCVEQKINTKQPDKFNIFMHLDVASGIIVTVFLIIGTLYVYFDESLRPLTIYAIILVIICLILIVYDYNRIKNKKSGH